MGAVLEANDRMLGRKVAMKVVLEERASEDARMRFIREATVLGQLEHPNIIPIYELGKDEDGNLFYAMKRVEGRTLQAILNDLKKGDSFTIEHYTLDRLLTVFRKVCDAVAFAHSKGIVHRDLKPENVMVGAFGEVLVMDWGLAKILKDVAQTADELEQQNQALASSTGEANEPALPSGFQELTDSQMRGSSEDLTMEGAVMGSPQYMPPEQAEGRIADIDERSDVYSLGGILYAILTLRPPIKGKTVRQVLENVKSGNITVPTEYNPGRSGAKAGAVEPEAPLPHCPAERVPSALSAVSMKALAADPDHRYRSVVEIAADVEAFQMGFATSAEDLSAAGQLALFIKRHRAVSIATLVGVAGIVTLSTGFILKLNTEKRVAVASEKKAREAESVATATLDDLRRTAPVFFEQARVDFEKGQLDQAFKKLGYAISLHETNADYHLFRAHLRQSSQALSEAAEGYRRVLELRSGDESARANLALTERLFRESDGKPLNQRQLLELLEALKQQGRTIEAAPIAARVAPDIEIARQAILARIRPLTAQMAWQAHAHLKSLPDGTFGLRLAGLKPMDFSVLNGTAVSTIHFDFSGITDFSTLSGLPLKEVSLDNAVSTDLSFVRGMPLERLFVSLHASGPTDFASLRGLRLKLLFIRGSDVRDLSFLRGMPLEKLILHSTAVPDFESLRGLPLRVFAMIQTAVPTDLSPLLDCPTLESIIIPPGTDPTVLWQLPRLRHLSTRRSADGWDHTPAQTAEEFWREFDAKAKGEKSKRAR